MIDPSPEQIAAELLEALHGLCLMIECGWIPPDNVDDFTSSGAWEIACSSYRDALAYDKAREVYAKYEALLRLPRVPLAAWQPIETAPLMRAALVCMQGMAGLGIYRAVCADWQDGGVNPRWRAEAYAMINDFPCGAQPTHWMPLPRPPLAEEGARRPPLGADQDSESRGGSVPGTPHGDLPRRATK